MEFKIDELHIKTITGLLVDAKDVFKSYGKN
jgi:hypothetical protein